MRLYVLLAIASIAYSATYSINAGVYIDGVSTANPPHIGALGMQQQSDHRGGSYTGGSVK